MSKTESQAFLRPKSRPQNKTDLKGLLETHVTRYKTPGFIANDSISFPHRFKADPLACEWVGLLSALFSYGQRPLILKTINTLLAPMAGDPMGFLRQFDVKKDRKAFEGFVYRFNRDEDIVYLLWRLRLIYEEHASLEGFFQYVNRDAPDAPLKVRLARLMDGLTPDLPIKGAPIPKRAYGLKFLLAHPDNGGGCKRMNMFFRWMVRQDEIDFGLWRKALRPADLLIPLDTHVAKTARLLGFTQRNANDWRTAEEITAALRVLCPEDPVRYDFALFGLGISAKDAIGKIS
jgi:uncharacterized protein (TIGR02757 family)